MIWAAAAVVFFSLLAFWKHDPILFMLAAGASIMVGLQWYDVYVTASGLAIGLMLIAYSLMCVGFAFALLFDTGKEISEE